MNLVICHIIILLTSNHGMSEQFQNTQLTVMIIHTSDSSPLEMPWNEMSVSPFFWPDNQEGTEQMSLPCPWFVSDELKGRLIRMCASENIKTGRMRRWQDHVKRIYINNHGVPPDWYVRFTWIQGSREAWNLLYLNRCQSKILIPWNGVHRFNPYPGGSWYVRSWLTPAVVLSNWIPRQVFTWITAQSMPFYRVQSIQASRLGSTLTISLYVHCVAGMFDQTFLWKFFCRDSIYWYLASGVLSGLNWALYSSPER